MLGSSPGLPFGSRNYSVTGEDWFSAVGSIREPDLLPQMKREV